MFRWIKDILGREDQTSVHTVKFSDVPVVLNDLANETDRKLQESILESRMNIIAARDQLQEIIRGITETERERASHPKLEKITRNSLPQFEKTLTSALSREFPEGTEEFYHASSECLKGCVKGLAGPGRYLRNVLPDEMKAIRVLVDGIGKEMNALTPEMSEWREKKDGISSLQDLYSGIRELMNTEAEMEQKIPELERSLGKERHRLEEQVELRQAVLDRLRQDSSLNSLKEAILKLEKQKSESEREVRALFSTLAHVFRKAEKLVQRGGSGKHSKEVHDVVAALTGKEIPENEEFPVRVNEILPVVTSMISTGEIQLKNQEEKQIFFNPGNIPGTISTHLSRRKQVITAFSEKKKQLQDHRHIRQAAELEENIGALRQAINAKEEQLTLFRTKRETSAARIPECMRKLEEGLSAILGEKVVFESD